MFDNYKIINNTLYLYIDDKFEIGKIIKDDKDSGIIKKIKDYINNHKIKFNGTKVVLLMSGLMLGTIYLDNTTLKDEYDVYKDNKYVYNIVDNSVDLVKEEEKTIKNSSELSNDIKEQEQISNSVIESKSITNKNENSNNTNNNITNNNLNSDNVNNNSNSNNVNNNSINNYNEGKLITLKRSNGEILQINLEEYLIGVVAGEMPTSFNIEALKAQSVVARTYTLKLMESGKTITDDVSTQVYKSNAELQNIWGSSYNTYYNKIKNAISSTKGLCIKYNGSLIDAVYHSTSNGYTEDPVNVWENNIPYLKIVSSPWDTSCSSFLRSLIISFDKISSVLGIDFNSSSSIEIISKDDSNEYLK